MLKEDNRKLYSSIEKNRKLFTETLGIGVTFDADVRRLIILDTKVDFYFVTGLNDKDHVNIILKELLELNDTDEDKKKVYDIIENRLVNQQVKPVDRLQDALTELLSGLVFVMVDGHSRGFAIDVRSYPQRSPDEPDTEKVVRGARDGYTENIIINTGLTRRRIRDENLRFEMIRVTGRGRQDVAISYIKDIADEELVKRLKDKIEHITIDGLSMGEKSLEEFILEQNGNPFPLVRFTERPDVAAAHLFEGHVLIFVDTSPSVIITPTTYFHHVQHAEEYRQSPTIGTFIRWIRFFGIFVSVFLLPLWLLFVLHPELLPNELSYIGPSEEGNIPIVLQVILADIGIEFLRIAAIHTPTAVSTAMGLIAAILIGEIAIQVGLFGPEIILYVALSTMGAYATPSYELSFANKIARLFIILLTALFGVSGFVIGCTFYVLSLTNTKSLDTPYFWPFIPFNAKAMFNILFRIPMTRQKTRPSITHPQDVMRQDTK